LRSGSGLLLFSCLQFPHHKTCEFNGPWQEGNLAVSAKTGGETGMSGDTRFDESLNEFQARRLRVTCQYIDGLLRDIEEILNAAASKAAFPRYVPDIAPAQRRTVEDYIARVRAQLVRILDSQGVAREDSFIPASRAVQVTLGAIDIAAEELKPKYMRGYGDLPEKMATELSGIACELQALMQRVSRYLSQGASEDLRHRLDRLNQSGNDLQLLGKIERIVRDRGLVEFRSAIAAILDRAEDKSFEIAVFGRVSSGKSSLLNAILGTDALPVGVTPITAVPTRIAFAEEPSLTVWFAELPCQKLGVGSLSEFATEQRNPGNSKHVTRIVVALPSTRLRAGVAFVDTPGLGSLAASGAAETLAYLPKCDLGVLLIDAGSTLTAEDLETILTLQQAAIPVSILLSKADLLTASDRSRTVQYVQEHVRSECGQDLSAHPVSVLPSHRGMLDAWFQNEIVPLYGKAQELRAASLRRKIGALRESVASSLEARARRGQRSPARSQDEIRGAEAVLRRTTGQIEEVRSLVERAVEGAASGAQDAIREAANELLDRWAEEDPRATTSGQLVREALIRLVQRQVRKLQENLITFANQLRHDLRQVASALGVANAPAENEFEEVVRATPVFEPSLLEIAISRPHIAGFVGRGVAARLVASRLRKELGPNFSLEFENYWRLVKAWTNSAMAQLGHRFDIYAEAYRAQAEQLLGAKETRSDELRAVQVDLAELGVSEPTVAGAKDGKAHRAVPTGTID
jgi:GTP-binding protein EngB required for normal cell division